MAPEPTSGPGRTGGGAPRSARARLQRGTRCFACLAFLLPLLLLPGALAAEVKLDTMRVGTKIFHHVTVLGVNDSDLYFTHDGGIANVKLRYLEPALQKRFSYDPKAAEAAERQQQQDEAAYSNALAQALSDAAMQKLKTARDAAASSEQSLADPISDASLLRKPAPAITPGKWLTEAPVTTNKVVLVLFWTTWSVPCHKVIAQLNGWQKKFGERLAVIGLCAQPEKEVAEFNEPRVEFASGLDPENKLAITMGATSVPYVLLIDAKGLVRYQGHPAALDEKRLEQLVAPASD